MKFPDTVVPFSGAFGARELLSFCLRGSKKFGYISYFCGGKSLQECLNRIYRSELYKKLATESTKYWHLGPVALYEELQQEL